MHDFKNGQSGSPGNQKSGQNGNGKPPESKAPIKKEPLTDIIQKINSGNVLEYVEGLGVSSSSYKGWGQYGYLFLDEFARRVQSLLTEFDETMVAYALSFISTKRSFTTLKDEKKFNNFTTALKLLKELDLDTETMAVCLRQLDCVFAGSNSDGRWSTGLLSTKLFLNCIDQLKTDFGPDTAASVVLAATRNKEEPQLDDSRFTDIVNRCRDKENAKAHPLYGLLSDMGFTDETDTRILKAYAVAATPKTTLKILEANLGFLQTKIQDYILEAFEGGLDLLGARLCATINVQTDRTSILEGSMSELEALCKKTQVTKWGEHPYHLRYLAPLGFEPVDSRDVWFSACSTASVDTVNNNLLLIFELTETRDSTQKKALRMNMLADPDIVVSGDDAILGMLAKLSESQTTRGTRTSPSRPADLDSKIFRQAVFLMIRRGFRAGTGKPLIGMQYTREHDILQNFVKADRGTYRYLPRTAGDMQKLGKEILRDMKLAGVIYDHAKSDPCISLLSVPATMSRKLTTKQKFIREAVISELREFAEARTLRF